MPTFFVVMARDDRRVAQVEAPNHVAAVIKARGQFEHAEPDEMTEDGTIRIIDCTQMDEEPELHLSGKNPVFASVHDEHGRPVEWRALFEGYLLAAAWQSAHAAQAHVAALEAGKARPHYSNPQEVTR